MLEYIYFVKCPGCDDEHFDFFNEAKEFAMDILSKKPIITQIEVNRNDFGECVDSCDLGTVWSWEDMIDDVSTEPESTTFSKADTLECDDCADLEFTSLDNSLDSVPDNFRKPVPADMTIEDLVEAMEENEDEVECTWCNELYGKDQCRKEVNLGWLCDRCQAAIMSRGEPLTFRENTYWDFLDESVDNKTLADLVADSINHLVNDLGKDPEAEDFTDDIVADIENNYDITVPEDPVKYKGWFEAVACEVSKQINNNLNEAMDPHDLVELEYPSLTVTLYGPQRDVDDWDEEEYTDSHVFLVPKVEVAIAIWENWITEEDVKDVEGGLDALEDDAAWDKYLETHFDDLFEKYKLQILDYFKDEATEDFRERSQEEHQLNNFAAAQERAWNELHGDFNESCEKQKPFLEEFDSAEDHKARLTDCPECGTVSYDMKEQYCTNCGLNL